MADLQVGLKHFEDIQLKMNQASGGGSSLAEVRRLCSSLVAAFGRDERFLKPSGASNSR